MNNQTFVSSPLRLSLFGGGTDIPSIFNRLGKGISITASLDLPVTVATVTRPLDKGVKLKYSSNEIAYDLNSIIHPIFKETLRYFDYNFENEKVGLKVWDKYFVPLKAINLGFGGDRTEHVLWRLDHLPVMKEAPKAAVLLIGTNNIGWGSDTPKQAAEGVQAIAGKLKAIYPNMNVLVLGVLPRRRNLDHPHRKQIIELNSYLPGLLKDMKDVKFLDIGPAFLDEKGFLSEEMMPDTTHPSEKGHEIWAEAIAPELKKMLGK